MIHASSSSMQTHPNDETLHAKYWRQKGLTMTTSRTTQTGSFTTTDNPNPLTMDDVGAERQSSRGYRAGTGDDTDYWSKNGPGPQVMAADTLEGDSVRNEAGEKLGEITDIMLDVPTGRVAYAVMSVGGVLGMGNKLFAIPWSALRLDPEDKCFRLDVAKDRLDEAPGFDKDHWPTMADQRWAEDVHSFYHARPYWS